LPQVTLEDTIPVIMSQAILDKIQHLCQKINKVEWSGVLFYSIKGSIKKPKTFKITLEDILPLDKGSATYTSYKLDDRFVEYLMEEPEIRMDWKVGQIHSHHNMSVFFSGVDMSELSDNCPQHNFYLSLIVNNYNDFEAKVAILGEATISQTAVPFLATDENGKKYTMETLDFDHKEERMYVYDCIIDSPIKEVIVPEDFSKKVEDLISPPKVIPIATAIPAVPVSKILPATNVPVKTPSVMTPNAQSTTGITNRATFIKNFSESFVFGRHTLLSYVELYEDFVCDLFNNGVVLESPNGVTAEDYFENLIGIAPIDIAKNVSDNYLDVYVKNFPDANSDAAFIYYTEQLLVYLESEYHVYEDITNPTIALLRAMIKKFKEYGTAV
jgi:hypothetical protein